VRCTAVVVSTDLPRRRAVAVAVLALLVAVPSACGGDGAPPPPSAPPSVDRGGTPGPGLTVTGEVTRRIEDRTFELGRDGPGPLLVLSVDRSDVDLGAVVTVTGRLRTLRIASLETELGIDLADERLAAFEGAAILVATTVEAP
jgi:hypothetical protein